MIRGEVLFHHLFGDPHDPPVLALHGLHGHGGRWRDQAARWAGRRVVAPDIRGHGRSPMLPPWNLEQHVADAVATMDATGLAVADVVGYAFGGTIALHLASTHPTRVRRLVLIDPSVAIEPALALAVATGLARPAFDSVIAASSDLRERWPWAAEYQIEAELADNLVQHDDGLFRWRFCAPAMATALSESARPMVLAPATVPTLLIRAQTTPVDESSFAGVCARLPNVTQVGLPHGHQLLALAPAETAEAVAKFLAH